MILDRSGAATALLLLLLIPVAGCARAPIPTSEQPTSVPTVPPAQPLEIKVGQFSTATTEPGPTVVPQATMALPLTTVAPTALPAVAQTPVSYDRNPRAILIEADVTGPTLSVPRDMHLPIFRLYADGFVVRAGETTDPATGFDAEVRTGRLSDGEIQDLLAYLTATGFFSLSAYYEPRPAPPNLPTAQISVYLNRTKTVTVYGLGFPGTPQTFLDAFNRITRTRPADDKTYTPTDAYLTATPAGSINEVKSLGEILEWPTSVGQSLSAASDGITISGTTFAAVARLAAKSPKMLFRDGSQVYRVRFAPSAPRAIHLTDWIGTILQGTREFEGRAFDIVGYYRGANLMGEARGNAPNPNAWVIQDDSGAMYVTGAVPPLDPNSRTDAWNIVRIRAVVVYIRSGTSYLDARTVVVQ